MSQLNSSVTFNYDNLFAGATAEITNGIETLAKGNNLKRGAVLGYIIAEGKVTLVDKSKTDGTEKVYAILAMDADATNDDIAVPVYYSGEFNSAKLTFSGSDTANDHKYTARMAGILFKQTIGQ